MAIVLDPTPGGASANSYGSLAEALAYFATRLGSTAYLEADSDEIRKQALITGTREIDQEIYRGQKATSTQALQWGRIGTYASGVAIPSDIIPAFVKFASFEQGLFRLQQAGSDGAIDPLGASGTEELKALGVGPIRLDFRDRDPNSANFLPRAADDPSRALSPQAYRFLRAYIITDTLHGQPGARNFSIVRGG